MKANAARLLDKLGIPYQILTDEVDPDDLAAESTAQKVGLPPEQVLKTLVVRGDTNCHCVPPLAFPQGTKRSNPKSLAIASFHFVALAMTYYK
ncbi:hypothetical protein [Nostoc sp. UHCC 0252]|uniref:hypothetical protein n=1 Tax=Nostoc sp. UHCC 0252 TaxID=3110241 RepID=UPI002B218F23|nr:hypothetical protein [Nostoc sp. UHCC 0252]MEA5601601.1 hypothetical protein [Nostoc sp. UHCC 0252]